MLDFNFGNSGPRSVISPIHIYKVFNGTGNLLFKDSTIGLASTEEEYSAITTYKELFKHADACSSAVATQAILLVPISLAIILALRLL